MTATSSAWTSTIAVLSLVVAIVAVFVGPFVARSNVQRQIQAAAREAWLREFRGQVAALFTSYAALREHARSHTTGDPEKERQLAEINDALTLRYHAIRLLIAEKGARYAGFVQNIDRQLNATTFEAAARSREIYEAAAEILHRERAVIEVDPWKHALRSRLGAVSKCGLLRAWIVGSVVWLACVILVAASDHHDPNMAVATLIGLLAALALGPPAAAFGLTLILCWIGRGFRQSDLQ